MPVEFERMPLNLALSDRGLHFLVELLFEHLLLLLKKRVNLLGAGLLPRLWQIVLLPECVQSSFKPLCIVNGLLRFGEVALFVLALSEFLGALCLVDAPLFSERHRFLAIVPVAEVATLLFLGVRFLGRRGDWSGSLSGRRLVTRWRGGGGRFRAEFGFYRVENIVGNGGRSRGVSNFGH